MINLLKRYQLNSKSVMFLALVIIVFVLTVKADNIDQSLYNTIRHDWQSATMDKIMKFTEFASSPTALAASNLAVFYFGGVKEQKVARLAVTSWTVASVSGIILKAICNRPRPENQQTSRWDSSFPSGHTLGYFSLATVYGNKYPKLAIPLYGFGVMVGLSRIYLGEHYPSDVVAGAIWGIGIGYLTLKLEKKLFKLMGNSTGQ